MCVHQCVYMCVYGVCVCDSVVCCCITLSHVVLVSQANIAMAGHIFGDSSQIFVCQYRMLTTIQLVITDIIIIYNNSIQVETIAPVPRLIF